MSIGAQVRAERRKAGRPAGPGQLTWRAARRQHKQQQRALRALIRRFGRGV